MGSLLAAACMAHSQSASNDEWVQFPPRPGPSAPKVQNDQPKAARSTPPVTASTDDGWIKFPPLPPPKPSSIAKPDAVAPVQATTPPPQTATPAPAPAPAAAAAPASKPPASSEFVFKAFKFEGNKVYSSKRLEQLLKTALPNVQDLTDLQKATDTLAQFYQNEGVLARVDLLPQDLTEGEVLITITEGKFAGAKLETPNSAKLSSDYLVKLVETAQPKGEAVRMSQLDRATLLLGEVPGVQANMRLRSGEREGESEALLQVAEVKAWDGQVSWDNAGPVSTGFNRLSTQLNRYGAFGRADISSMQYMHSDGTDYLRLAYSEPLGYWGSRWGTNMSLSRYKVVTNDYLTLNPHGPANSVGFDMTLPLLRSRTSSASMQVAMDRKFFRNNTNAGVISDYFMDTVTTSLQGTRNDEWWGGGETSVGAQVVRGLVDLSGSPNEKSDASSSMTAGRFTKLRLNLNRQQTLGPTTQLVGSYQTQVASKNLDGSEKFSLGGMQGVRAYPSSEANGNAAQLLTVEYQKTLQVQQYPFKLSAFLDAGRVTKLKFNTGSGINTYNLQGAGLWVGSSLPNRWGQAQWRMTWAHRIGTNPAAQANGLDLDGTLHNDRFWLSVIQQF
ncbi:MAG: ShlB/FhaC/HecB family hemolysin secretion/activation protein [Betaproteobacteria bacterium]|nr:ShlB/FhaC/HecB family hemolysin secretion/activation protein [Betaproteobacteria bacterium]